MHEQAIIPKRNVSIFFLRILSSGQTDRQTDSNAGHCGTCSIQSFVSREQFSMNFQFHQLKIALRCMRDFRFDVQLEPDDGLAMCRG
jgi:hypothetical protein